MASQVKPSSVAQTTAAVASQSRSSRVSARHLAALLPGGRPSLEQQSRFCAENRRWIDAACRLRGDLEMFDGLQRLLLQIYGDLVVHWAKAITEEEVEALHEVRIAIRKVRALLRGFRKPLRPSAARTLDRHLRRLNRALGPARDLDAWIAFLQDPAAGGTATAKSCPAGYVARQRSRRRREQTTVRRLLGPGAFLALQSRFDQLLRIELPRLRAESSPLPLAEAARRVLAKHFRRTRQLDELRYAADPDERHRLRIALRRLRYLAGFFAPLLGPPISELHKRVHAAERVLGELRDTSRDLARAQHDEPPPPRRLLERLRERQARAEAALEKRWSHLDRRGFRREVRAALRTAH